MVSGGREGGLLLLSSSSDGGKEEEKENEEDEKRKRSVKDTTSHTADSYPNAAPPAPSGSAHNVEGGDEKQNTGPTRKDGKETLLEYQFNKD